MIAKHGLCLAYLKLRKRALLDIFPNHLDSTKFVRYIILSVENLSISSHTDLLSSSGPFGSCVRVVGETLSSSGQMDLESNHFGPWFETDWYDLFLLLLYF